MDEKNRIDTLNNIKIFTGNSNLALVEKVCDYLSIPLGKATVGRFPDGEIDVKVDEDVRGSDIFIIQPTCSPVNDSLVELLILIDCFKRASSARITAVLPYYGYARKDRKDEGRVPITAKLVANLITKAGADRVLTMDLHAAQIQGFFDIPVDHLLAFPVISEYYREKDLSDFVVVSPDVGGIKIARHIQTI
jgi:ribose-phosphate pyrophosphokinase